METLLPNVNTSEGCFEIGVTISNPVFTEDAINKRKHERELLNKIWPVKRLSEYGMKKEEIDEFAEEVYRELQVPLATSYVPLSLEELKEINRNLY